MEIFLSLFSAGGSETPFPGGTVTGVTIRLLLRKKKGTDQDVGAPENGDFL